MLVKLHAKLLAASKMKNDLEFIPCSARFEFKFHIPREVKEHELFAAVNDTAQTTIEACQNEFKSHIVKVIKLQVTCTQHTLARHLTKSIPAIFQAQLHCSRRV